MTDKLIQIPKPELGRANDSRLTREYIASRPELRGALPFDPAVDVDIVEEVNKVLGQLHALVQYADPELHGELTQTLTEAQKTLADTAQSTADALARAEDAQLQSLTQAGAVRFANAQEREANARPDGTWSYTLATREFHRFEGGHWQLHGEGVASAGQLNGPPVGGAGVNLPTIIRGGKTMYPLAPGDLTPADGVTVIEHRGAKYYRPSMTIDPREFGALAGKADGQVDATAELYAWLQAAQRGTVMYLPPGFWYTNATLRLPSKAGVRYDFGGVLRPITDSSKQFTGPLIESDGGMRDVDSLYGAVADGNHWGNSMEIARMQLDGMFLCRGSSIYMYDHFRIQNVTSRRTYGYAQRWGNLREGVLSGSKIAHCMAGPDEAVLMFTDQYGTEDQTNSIKVKDFEVVWNHGRMLYVDKHPDSGGRPRLLDFIGCHFEDLTPVGLKMRGGTLVKQSPTLDRMWIRDADSVTFTGGILAANPYKDATKAGDDQYFFGGSAVRIGDSGRNPTGRVKFDGVKAFADAGDGAFYKVENGQAIVIDDELNAPQSVVPVWKNPNNASNLRRVTYSQQVLRGDSGHEALVLESSGGGNTPLQVFRMADGQQGRVYVRNAVDSNGQGVMAFVFELPGGKNIILDANGRIYGDGSSPYLHLGMHGHEINTTTYLLNSGPPANPQGGTVAFCVANDGWNPGGKPNGTLYPVYFDGGGWRAFS